MRLLLAALLVFVHLAGLAKGDSTRNAAFEKLANKMRLGTPKRQDLAYEVRIWHDQSFQYGDAQQLYRLIKTKDIFSLTKYVIKSGKNGFKSAKKIESTVPITDSLWKQVVQLGILNMPDEKAIESKLRPIQQNNPGWRFGPDSTVTIYNSKIERSVYILENVWNRIKARVCLILELPSYQDHERIVSRTNRLSMASYSTNLE